MSKRGDEGTPPFPAPIANAICGPQKPGSEAPADASKDISEMNPCLLNACCNIWGQCGITKDFCVDTNTGAPGTAEKDTYGCILKYGMDIKQGNRNGEIKIGYYQGYCLSRDCLYQDPLQIDTSIYTHLHFGFGTPTPEFDIEITDFIKEHDLDSVNIDWEYPGAPDLPTFNPGTKEDRPNYLAFLVVLKNLLPGKSVAITAPASYWYLKQFPIEQISKIVNYIVYMTYDLHGQ
ncbi:glycoside hydrolase superfamily [Aspergillus undulatus]|uniref:glycoside hydrolase superfamily n=1 Tax=Aspergillus undulatus TaxID=1810928 RepID=UPI003CCD4ADE